MERRTKILVAAAGVAACMAGGIIINNFNSSNRSDLNGFDRFPHTYVTAEDAGYDPSKIVIWAEGLDAPASLTLSDGRVAWPAVTHPDPAVVATSGGRPYIFPLIGSGLARTSPPLPPAGKSLDTTQLELVQRYHTEEGAAMLAELAEFAKKRGSR